MISDGERDYIGGRESGYGLTDCGESEPRVIEVCGMF